MKKPINITGLVLILLLLVGVIFKRLHLPGASIFLVVGMVFFILLYVPFYIGWVYQAAKATERPSSKFIAVLTIIGIVFMSLGAMFKIMHWPGALKSVWIGLAIVCIGITLFLIQNRKLFFESLSMISVLVAILILGTFSFNFIDFRHFRGLWQAEKFINPVFSESSNQIRDYCLQKLEDENLLVHVDSAKYTELLMIQKMALELDDVLESKINELISFTEEAEQIGTSWDERMRTIDYKLFAENFIENFNEDLTGYRDAVNEFQLRAGKGGIKLENSFISDPDYLREDLKSKYFASKAIYESAYITALEMWRNRIWRVFFGLTEKI